VGDIWTSCVSVFRGWKIAVAKEIGRALMGLANLNFPKKGRAWKAWGNPNLRKARIFGPGKEGYWIGQNWPGSHWGVGWTFL